MVGRGEERPHGVEGAGARRDSIGDIGDVVSVVESTFDGEGE